MSEERPQHTQEPAEGSDEDVEASGAQRAEEADEQAEERVLGRATPRSTRRVAMRTRRSLAPNRRRTTVSQLPREGLRLEDTRGRGATVYEPLA